MTLQAHFEVLKKVGNPSSVLEHPGMATQFVKLCPLRTAQIAGGLVVVCFYMFYFSALSQRTLSTFYSRNIGLIDYKETNFSTLKNMLKHVREHVETKYSNVISSAVM